jgi:hypothetical protein
MLTEPTHCGLWITWRGLQCEAALGLVHLEETTLQTVPIHENCVVVEVIIVYTIFADELLEYPPNVEVMKLGQAQGQRLQWRRCQIDIKVAQTCISHTQDIVQIPCSSHSTVEVLSSDGSPPPPPPPQSPHVPSPHPEGTKNIPSPPTPSPEKIEKLASPHPQETPNIPSPPPPPPSPPHEITKPTPPNGSAQNNHAKAGTYGPNTSVIGPGETPLGKKTLEKPSAISNQQEKKLAENNISTPRTTGKKSLEKPSTISKLQEEKLAKNKSSTPPTAGKQALKKPSSAISKQQEKEIAVNKTSKRPTRK